MALVMPSLEQLSNASEYFNDNFDNVTIKNSTSPYFGCLMFIGNMTYLNISCESELEYSIPLYGYCTPFLLLITMTANSLIVIVLSRRNMATPTNSVLMGKFLLIFVLKYYVLYWSLTHLVKDWVKGS